MNLQAKTTQYLSRRSRNHRLLPIIQKTKKKTIPQKHLNMYNAVGHSLDCGSRIVDMFLPITHSIDSL